MIFGLDMIMDWEEAAQIVKATGFDGWIEHIAKRFPDRNLSSTSIDWYELGPKYIAKLKGEYGDVVVGWKWRFWR